MIPVFLTLRYLTDNFELVGHAIRPRLKSAVCEQKYVSFR